MVDFKSFGSTVQSDGERGQRGEEVCANRLARTKKQTKSARTKGKVALRK